jgi:hypothetical protein
VKKLILEKNKKSGVYYAITEDGIELPIVDITHPAFALHLTEAELADLYDRYVRKIQKRGFLQRHLFQFFLKRSILGRGIMGALGGFLAGMNTYLLKIGADNLGSFANQIDREIAEALPSVSLRLRLQDMAHLLADALLPLLQAKPEQELHLLNIAGGPAMDSLNALILIPNVCLMGRKIVIHVLDGDTAGPLFGQRALQALQSEGAPLAGLDIEFHHFPYDWAKTSDLQTLIDTIPSSAILAASSEGGLFEYGSDAEIISNLQELRPRLTAIVGSISRKDRQTPILHLMAVRPRELEGFKNLALQGGWTLARILHGPISCHFCLKSI